MTATSVGRVIAWHAYSPGCTPTVVGPACNPSHQELEARGSGVQAILSYIKSFRPIWDKGHPWGGGRGDKKQGMIVYTYKKVTGSAHF